MSSYIGNEVVRRLRREGGVRPELLATVGIDPATQPLEPLDDLDVGPGPADLPGEGPAISGAIPFELTVSAIGETETIDCRARFAATLYDQEDAAGVSRRIIGRIVTRYEVLDWRDDENLEANGDCGRRARPIWAEANLWPLLPDSFHRRVDDMIEEEALRQELLAKSAS